MIRSCLIRIMNVFYYILTLYLLLQLIYIAGFKFILMNKGISTLY